MTSYKFVFAIGFLNLSIPFFGVPSTYKYVAFVAIGVATIGYALFERAVIKEKEAGLVSDKEIKAYKASHVVKEERTIEDVIEMDEEVIIPVGKKRAVAIRSDVVPKRAVRKPKVKVIEEIYE